MGVTFQEGTQGDVIQFNPDLINQQANLAKLRHNNQLFYQCFEKLQSEFDSSLIDHVVTCGDAMDNTPWDEVDSKVYHFKRNAQTRASVGLVDRRGPKNPFKSKKFSKKKYENKDKKKKTDDPAMQNIPLRGRQIVNIGTCSLLFWVFLCEISYAYINFGHTTVAEFDILYSLGGLYTNSIRAGQVHRLFWACYMHSGWMHIGMNLLCQINYLMMYEPDWGFWRVAIVFWGSALGGNVFSATLDPCMITVGSSGSLFGLMGACLPYTIEYWTTLPRPWMIAILTFVVMAVTIAMGFNESGTDNWAHIGGGLCGMFIGFMGTVNLQTAPDCCRKNKKNNQPAVVRKNCLFRTLQGFSMFKSCKCGWREWALRIVGLVGFAGVIGSGFYFLLVDPKYQPWGSITYSGLTSCCCCSPAFFRSFTIQQADAKNDDPMATDEGWFSTTMIDNRQDNLVLCGACVGDDDHKLDTPDGKAYPEFADPLDPTTWTSIQRSFPCAWAQTPRGAEEQARDPFDANTWGSIPSTSIRTMEPRSVRKPTFGDGETDSFVKELIEFERRMAFAEKMKQTP